MQFGTNHLGHFALTGLLLDNMLASTGRGWSTVSSVGHRIRARIHFDDPQLTRKYNRVEAYGQSKLANLMFTYELQRRLKLKGAPTVALAAHPGFADTELMRYIPGFIPAFMWRGLLQPAEKGALGDSARGDRPRCTGRPVLRSRRPRRNQGKPEGRQVQRAVARRGHSAPAVEPVRGTHRREVSGLMSTKWTSADVPNQSGRVAIITGSNTGVGYEAAAVLAAQGRARRAGRAQPRQGQ